MESQNFHESYNLSNTVKIGSNRKFGFIFCIIFLLLAFAPIIKHHPVRLWALALSILFVTAALVYPNSLKHINLCWMTFAETLRKITTPLLLLIVFFIVLTPIALILKIFKKDLLNLHFSKSSTYWIKEDGVVMSLKDQF